jgi:predicted porin
MKKSLIALAVLAASGASFAQSSVTLYGIADVYLASQKAMGTDLRQTVIGSGGVSGSRYGFKGTEDLGGGLKANFKLEQGFSLDTGAAGQTDGLFAAKTTASFSRYAYVGFSGGFGEVKLGKTGTPYDDVSGASNPVFDSALSPQNEVWLSGNYTWNPSNSIYYVSPSMGGFSAAGSYSMGENKTANYDAGAVYSASVQYANGPIAAALAYQVEEATAPTLASKFTRLNGSYDLGVVKILAGFGRVTGAAAVGVNGVATSSAQTTEWELGVDYPVSSALTISGGIARSTDNATAGDATREGYGIGANYTLSKRTSVYGGFREAKTTPAVGADFKGNLVAVGIKHTF